MPKNKKKSDKNKEEILDELGFLFKKSTTEKIEGHEEESELEEDVGDQNLNLQALEFHQLMEATEPTEAGAPVLERIAGSAPRPIFVGGIPQGAGTTVGNEESKGDDFKYVPGTADTGEPKYFAEPGVGSSPERIDFTRAGRTATTGFREEISQERFFRQSEPAINLQAMERFERPERFDVERAGRRDVFERPEAKYEKYRPKLPKS